MTRLEALEAAEEAGHEGASSAGGPAHRYGCRMYSSDGWLIARGATWAECAADLYEPHAPMHEDDDEAQVSGEGR